MNTKFEYRNKSLILIGLIMFVFSMLFLRLVDIQLINGSIFEKLAFDNKTYRIVSPEERGVFLDRYSQPLVFNKPIYYKVNSGDSLYSDETRISHDEALQIMAQDSDLIRMKLERMYLYPKSLSQVLGYVGSVSTQDLINDSGLGISDKIGKFGLEKEYQNYLRGNKGSKVYEINAMGEKQHLIAEEAGTSGMNVPTTIDPQLSQVALRAMGDNKGSVLILDASNSEVLTLISTPSFDSSILSETFKSDEEERKRAIAIQDSFSNPQNLFFNRAVSGLYPPGSIFKLITALAGLEGKKIDESTSVLDEGVLKVGDYSYSNWYFTQFGGKEGEISLIEAISRSNDIYFYKVAEWVGPTKLKEMASLFSLGEQTGIQLQAEASGLIPDPEWKQRVLAERWFLGNTYHMGIGQGDILVSPIQIAQMIQSIANNGNLCNATLVKNSFQEGGLFVKNRCREVGVMEENINLLLRGMINACSPNGTAFPFFNHNAQILEELNESIDVLKPKELIDAGMVACKTGTSEFGETDWRNYRKTHAWFASIIGTKTLIKDALEDRSKSVKLVQGESELVVVDTENSGEIEQDNEKSDDIKVNRDLWLDGVEKYGFPEEIVIVVFIESDEINPYKEGSKDAAPVAKEIFDWIHNGDPVK